MKKRLVALLAIVFAVSYFAFRQTTVESKRFNSSKTQTENSLSELQPQFVQAAAFATSVAVSSLAPAQPAPDSTNKKTADEKARAVPNNLPFRKQVAGAAHDADALMAKTSVVPMPTPALSFDGISSNDNAAAYGFRVLPPDTNGDVGPNHYVQSVNSLTRVYDKQGNPLTPPFKLSSIFSALGTPCSARDDGDPIVLYDALADRWILSQFCNNFPPFRQMLAVSKTGDPTGAYFIYEFVMPNVKINDYPKFGVWTDAYYMTTDEFLGGDYAGSGMFAFDKRKLLTGDAGAGYIYFDLASPTTLRIGGLLPTDLDGFNPPPAGAPNVFVGYSATEYGDAADAVRLFEFRADFVNPANSTFTERAESPITVAAFDPTSTEGRADIFQPPMGEALDSQSDRLMYRVAYRNFGTHESLVFNQTVRTSPIGQTYRAGVRIYELRKTNNVFSVHEQATVGDNSISRWMASAAQDYQGNLAVGYSTGSEEKKPSISYTGKLAGEPNGTFRPEADLIVGTGVQRAFGFRWGDYSAMSVDAADDCTFWITNQYYSQASEEESDFGWLTRIGKFKFDECVSAPQATIQGTVTNAANGQPIADAVVETETGFFRSTAASGNYSAMKVSPGNYIFKVRADGFRPVSLFPVNAPNGAVVVQNFALEPTAVLTESNFEITSESCSLNGAIEPGETVTVNIALQNTGSISTTNLIARLVEFGGVTNPSAPQNYGALVPNGASVSRSFTFTASSALACGDTVSINLSLEDNLEPLGVVTINLNTGTPRVVLQENFDTVDAPALPAGWTTSATGMQQNWRTSTARAQSLRNSLFSPAPNQVGLNEVVSPVFPITTTKAEISFRNWYELETTFLRNRLYDGSVLEIKIGNQSWQDIEAAGGAFLSGGYDGVIDACCQNPLAGRRGWSGRSGINQTSVFITSRAKLPPAARGRDIQLRWRVGTDIGTFREGQYIDNLVVTDGFACSCGLASANRAPFDFDGDGKTDFSVFRPSDNAGEADFFIQNSSTDAPQSAAWGNTGDRAANADFDGDGKTDFAVFRPSSATWFILQSSNNFIAAINFGLADDRLAPADFDGDSKADIAVYRQSNGTWYILQSSNSQIRVQQFGIAEDLPVQADFDGDSKVDIAIFRPSTGVWYVSRSSDNGFTALQFGLSGDKAVAGDYDGDGRADLAVFRPSDRNWYLLRSAQGLSIVQFGLSDDKPLQADFDGDSKADIAVFRPSNSIWYYLKSSDGGFAARQFGASGDTALPSIFVSQ